MLEQEKEAIFKILNSQYLYWSGLKSVQFWQELGINRLFAVAPIMLSILTIGANFVIEIELDKK